jgi:hypothetical protein
MLKPNFSSHLFWDTDRNKLDTDRDKDYIIRQVLEYGLMDDWRLIKEIYGLDTIVASAKNFRSLDKKTLNFIATISDEPKESFRCYTEQQSIQKHLDF